MGGIVTKRRTDASVENVDFIRSEIELNEAISSTRWNNQSSGSEPFRRNEIRRVWSTNSNTDNVSVSRYDGQRQRPPLHPTRNSPPTNNNSNDGDQLSPESSNNIHSSNNTPRSLIIGNISANSTPVSKDQLSLLSCINQTPVGDEKSKFQYYCPLCMRHFQETLVVSCCNNYICFECTIDFLGSKSIEATRLEDIMSPQSKDILKNVTCPHCCQQGFLPNRVNHTDEVKNYTITPRACQCENSYNGMSPLKAGDSFEKMSQKMLKFGANVKIKRNIVESPVVDATIAIDADDNGSEDNTSRRLSPTSLQPMIVATTSLIGPEVDEEHVATQIVGASSFHAPVVMNTPMRRKVAVESYVEELLCEVFQNRSTVAC